jgi:hypothetical protein
MENPAIDYHGHAGHLRFGPDWNAVCLNLTVASHFLPDLPLLFREAVSSPGGQGDLTQEL